MREIFYREPYFQMNFIRIDDIWILYGNVSKRLRGQAIVSSCKNKRLTRSKIK